MIDSTYPTSGEMPAPATAVSPPPLRVRVSAPGTRPGAAPAAAPVLRWQWSAFADLTAADLYAVLAARQQVFVVEQACVYLDTDGLDADAWHLLGWVDDIGPAPALGAYLRLIPPGRKFAEPAIGRVLTTARCRGTGLGRALMREGLARSAERHPGAAVRISAQYRLERFYASLGFRTVSPPFDEDGIPHVEMLCPARAAAADAIDMTRPGEIGQGDTKR